MAGDARPEIKATEAVLEMNTRYSPNNLENVFVDVSVHYSTIEKSDAWCRYRHISHHIQLLLVTVSAVFIHTSGNGW